MPTESSPSPPSASGVRARVTVYPRRDILDPQGKAILQALLRLGFSEVSDVRAGKSFDVVLAGKDVDAARAALERMAGTLLANPVVEDFTVELVEDGA